MCIGAASIHVLEHLEGSNGIHPLPSKVQAIVNFHSDDHAANYKHSSVLLTSTWLCQDPRPTQLASDLYYRAPHVRQFLEPSLCWHQTSLHGCNLTRTPEAECPDNPSDSAFGGVLQQYTDRWTVAADLIFLEEVKTF